MTTTILQGDVFARLPTVADRSVQMCLTSPPYFNLRDYGTEPQVYGGDSEHTHEWGDASYRRTQPSISANSTLGGGSRPTAEQRGDGEIAAAVCSCGAWRGQIGNEPTPDAFVATMVAVFREVRRVLRDDGILICNLGDSYSGSGKGPTGHNGIGDQETRQGFRQGNPSRWKEGTAPSNRDGLGGVAGIPPKNLLMIPFRAALALQADGWYLRSVIPWIKRNPMPESVTDRPSTAVEYLFLFSKRGRYFWDHEAVRQPALQPVGDPRLTGDQSAARSGATFHRNGLSTSVLGTNQGAAGRSYRNSDAFFQSWQGLLGDEDGDPLALVVNTFPFKGSHFATFPPGLVEPFVKAGTSQAGQCPACGAPWKRVVERTTEPRSAVWTPKQAAMIETGSRKYKSHAPGWRNREQPSSTSAGWSPSCACKDAGPPVPQTVLDPFAGAGTTLMVADRLGRDAVGIELDPKSVEMARARLVDDAPMFASVEVAAGDVPVQADLFEVAG